MELLRPATQNLEEPKLDVIYDLIAGHEQYDEIQLANMAKMLINNATE
jgi:hypothetical protein